MARYFTKALFDFLSDLADHNNRAWFDANKERYEHDVKEPFLEFIADTAAPLRKISRYIVADPRPVGGSMFRIYRDVRFSKDKSPYKTAIAAHFPLGGKDVNGPGYYLHIEPGRSLVGGGMWMPDAGVLARIRSRIVEKPAEWKKARAHLDDEGAQLKRPPQGFDPDHPLIEDIKRKSYTSGTTLADRKVTAADFMDTFISECREMAPLVRFLAASAGVDW